MDYLELLPFFQRLTEERVEAFYLVPMDVNRERVVVRTNLDLAEIDGFVAITPARAWLGVKPEFDVLVWGKICALMNELTIAGTRARDLASEWWDLGDPCRRFVALAFLHNGATRIPRMDILHIVSGWRGVGWCTPAALTKGDGLAEVNFLLTILQNSGPVHTPLTLDNALGRSGVYKRGGEQRDDLQV